MLLCFKGHFASRAWDWWCWVRRDRFQKQTCLCSRKTRWVVTTWVAPEKAHVGSYKGNGAI